MKTACLVVALTMCAALSLDGVCAQPKDAEPVIGDMTEQTIPARHYIHGGFDTDFKNMGKPIDENLSGMIKTVSEHKLPLLGPVMHYYHGAPHRAPDKGFKMETGYFVSEDSKDIGDFKVRELPKFKCATILYTGPAPRIGEAWVKLFKAVADKNLTPTDEERELYLYWEGVDSPNNVVQVMVGVK